MKMKRIVLMMPLNMRQGRQIALGIYEYARHLPWDFRIINNQPGALETLRHWSPDGIIGLLGRQDLLDDALSYGIPTVCIYGGKPFHGKKKFSQVGASDKSAGRVAAEHLIDCGFTNFAYFGLPGEGFQSGRREGFRACLKEHGFDFHDAPVGELPAGSDKPDKTLRPIGGTGFQHVLQPWLKELPKPVAVFACDDLRAVWVSEVCTHLGLRIPEEVAILGADDDEVLCHRPRAPLSSVVLPFKMEGYRAAELLDKALDGKKSPASPVQLEPEGVHARQSTDIVAIDDPGMSAAVNYIRRHAWEGITVQDVVDNTGLSRRLLGRRFRKYLDRSPHEEIRRLQMMRARELLQTTNKTIDEIAVMSGFGSNIHLCLEFKKKMDTSPGAYRKRFQVS